MTKTKRILLVSPLENTLFRTDMYPSGALILMGTMLNNMGYEIKIIHMASDKIGVSELKNIIVDFEPGIVGITINTFQTKFSKQISKMVKEIDKNILVVVGGPHPSALKLKIFDDFPFVDIVVYGEGELTFLEIIEGNSLKEIKGICYDNKINEPRPRHKDLDYIPLPNLDLVGFDGKKFTGAEPVSAHPSMYIMASRGCPYQCTFCNKSVWGNTAIFRKPESIVREIEWLHEKYGIKEIFFQDDTFNLNRNWAETILHLIIDRGLNKHIIYRAPFRANENLVDEELLRLAKEAGFWLIFYGVESGNQEMLNRIKKCITVKELKRAFELTHKVGLKTIGSFIIGMPGEDETTIRDTFNLWKELKPYEVGFSPAIPFPETEFEKVIIEKGHLLVKDYDEYSPDSFIVRTDKLAKEDLEYYRSKITIQIILAKITIKNLIRKIISPYYFKTIVIDSFRNLRSIVKRLKSVFRLLRNVL